MYVKPKQSATWDLMATSVAYKLANESGAPLRDEFDGEFEGFESDSLEKDEQEIELEKVLFGDDKGFHDGLTLHKKNTPPLPTNGDVHEDEEKLDDRGLEGLDDADVRNIDCVSPYPHR